MPPDHKWLTHAEVCRQLDINPSTLYRLCAKGRIAHYRIGAGGGKIRFTQAGIDEYLSSALVPVRVAGPEEMKQGLQIPLTRIRPQGSKKS